jgi:hypothetical protein
MPGSHQRISGAGKKKPADAYKPIVEGYFNDLFPKGRNGEVGSNSDVVGEDFIKN